MKQVINCRDGKCVELLYDEDGIPILQGWLEYD